MDLFGRGLPRFSVVVEDPAWNLQGGGVRGVQTKYKLMTDRDIVNLPIGYCLADDVHYWMWAADNYLGVAFEAMARRGVTFKRTWPWIKGVRLPDGSVKLEAPGTGQYGRNQHEYLLFGTRGKAWVPPPDCRPDSVIVGPTREHSQKPDEAWDVIEMVSRPGPRIEFNARTARPGWTAVGHETSGGTIEQFLAPYRC